jgi:hypothetical protein
MHYLLHTRLWPEGGEEEPRAQDAAQASRRTYEGLSAATLERAAVERVGVASRPKEGSRSPRQNVTV